MTGSQSATMVHWVYEVTIKEGQLDNLKGLIAEMVAGTRASEPETLIYRWMVSEDGRTGQVHERYPNSEAAMVHMTTFTRDFADRLGTMADLARHTVYGRPSAALKQAIAGSNPIFFDEIAGFER